MRNATKRISKWYLINIKARTNQECEHYINAFNSLLAEDPLVDIGRKHCMSIKSMDVIHQSELLVIQTTIMSYTIIDPDGFYNRREKTKISLNWDENLVANMKQVETIFYPDIHILALKSSSGISINNVVRYFQDALNRVEQETFDVTTIKNRDVISSILQSEKIISLSANISFSNPGHSNDFEGLLDNKIRETNPAKLSVQMEGSPLTPLQKNQDGLMEAIINLSEMHGDVVAKIMKSGSTKIEVIKTREYPDFIRIPATRTNFSAILKDFIMRHLPIR